MTGGFKDPGLDSQAVFRAALDAMARPGSLHRLPEVAAPPVPLSIGAAALALTLCDFETTLWLDERLALSLPVTDYLRFHAGAKLTDIANEASFALVAEPMTLPDLARFALGEPDFPDRSTTLLLQVGNLRAGEGWRLGGPGIDGHSRLAVDGLPADFVAQRQRLAALFPLGLDIFLVADRQIAALPRTTVIEE